VKFGPRTTRSLSSGIVLSGTGLQPVSPGVPDAAPIPVAPGIHLAPAAGAWKAVTECQKKIKMTLSPLMRAIRGNIAASWPSPMKLRPLRRNPKKLLW